MLSDNLCRSTTVWNALETDKYWVFYQPGFIKILFIIYYLLSNLSRKRMFENFCYDDPIVRLEM